jgi:PAS domain S-box-containing protein
MFKNCIQNAKLFLFRKKRVNKTYEESETKYRTISETAMLINEERLRATLKPAQIGMSDRDLERDTWYASPIYYTMLGYEPIEGPSDKKMLLKRTHPDDRDIMRKKINSVLGQKKSHYSLEARILHTDGSFRWYHIIGHIIEKENQGKIKRMVGIRKDITNFKLAEEELKKSKRHLRTLIDTIPDLIWLKDPQGVFLQCNQHFEQLYGAPEKEIVGKTDYDFVSKELADFFRKKDNEARAAGKPSINEEEVSFADGHKEILETIKTPVFGYDGELIGVLGIGRDITQRKQIEQALRENQRFLETLISNLPGMVYRCKNDVDWTMEFLSEGCLSLTGYKTEQLISSKTISYGDIIHEEDKKKVWKKVQDMISLKQPFFIEYRIIHANGTIKWVWEQGRGVFSESGDLLFLEGFITDITERKQAENELKENEELFKILLKLAPYPIVLTDLNNRYILVNDAYFNTNNISETNVIGKTPAELGLVFDTATKEYINKKMTAKGRVENVDLSVTLGNGEKKEFLYSSVLIRWKNEPMILHSSIDITEKKKTERELEKHRKHLELLVRKRTDELEASFEELRATNEELYIQKEELQTALNTLNATKEQLIQSEKMASLGVLSAGIAHEINNPLNFIHGGILSIEYYLKEQSTVDLEQIKPFINAINEGVKRSAQIVTSLSHYSRQDDLPMAECDIHTIIDNCLIMLQNQLKGKVEVIKRYTEKKHTIFGNEGKLHQAILNIIVNAEQAIEKSGSIEINTDIINKQMVISIKDSGSGMNNETIEKIFDPFFTTKDPGKGTGLGLSITFNIIQEHNGKIECESKINNGTKVIIRLPIS